MIITQEIASADAIILLQYSVPNYCILYLFYGRVELDFLFFTDQNFQVQTRWWFPFNEMNHLYTYVALLPFNVNTLPVSRPQAGWETSTVECCCLDQFLFSTSLLADDPRSKP